MNPWYIAAILAGGLGVASLASAAAAQAKAGLPKVTKYAITVLPTPGVNGQWDLWVTELDGKSGAAMLASIPGNQMIYIPAATVQSQPTTADWSYTFTPKGATTPFTIVVPAAILQAYAKEPKTKMRVMLYSANFTSKASSLFGSLLTPPPQTVSSNVADIISRAQSIVNNFPPDGSDPSAYVTWSITTAGQVPGVINDINNVVNLSSTAANDVATLQALLTQLGPLVAKATAQAANIGSGGGGTPVDTSGGSTS